MDHTGERPWACSQCDKSFIHLSAMKKHNNIIHIGYSPEPNERFTCDQCGKSFKGKSGLKYHILVHTGIKDFKCASCNKAFTNRQSQTEHSLIHTAKNSFECKKCGSMLLSRSRLLNHRTHTYKPNLFCAMCAIKHLFSRRI